jgi:hypothetical protein
LINGLKMLVYQRRGAFLVEKNSLKLEFDLE